MLLLLVLLRGADLNGSLLLKGSKTWKGSSRAKPFSWDCVSFFWWGKKLLNKFVVVGEVIVGEVEVILVFVSNEFDIGNIIFDSTFNFICSFRRVFSSSKSFISLLRSFFWLDEYGSIVDDVLSYSFIILFRFDWIVFKRSILVLFFKRKIKKVNWVIPVHSPIQEKFQTVQFKCLSWLGLKPWVYKKNRWHGILWKFGNIFQPRCSLCNFKFNWNRKRNGHRVSCYL